MGRGRAMGWFGVLTLLLACGGPTEPAPSEGPERTGGKVRKGKDPERAGKGGGAAARAGMNAEQSRLADALEAIGYAEGTQEAVDLPVIGTHDRARAWQGLNLVTSGHNAEVSLLDMEGQEVWRWSLPWNEAFPRAKVEKGEPGTHHFRRARLGPDGTVYAVFEGRGIVAIAPDGTRRWAVANGAHHDVVVLEGGTQILVLVREARVDPRLHPTKPVLDDAVAVLDAATGRTVRRVSLWDALIASDLQAEALPKRGEPHGDLLHANSVFPLDDRLAGRLPAWSAGRYLVSLREPSMLVVIDPDAGRVVDWRKGPWRRQHDAELTPSGELLVFDNDGLSKGARGLVLDPVDGSTTWSWGHSDAHPFRSNVLGTIQELPNGNLLLTESVGGRALEVTRPGGEVVWAYNNPRRAGARDTLVATLFEVERLPASALGAWATAAPRATSAP